MRRVRLIGLAVCLGGALALGCHRAEAPPRLSIGVIPIGTTHRYWLAVHAGAAVAARELDVDLFWPPAFRDGDAAAQLRAIRRMRARGVSGLAVAPLTDEPVHRELMTIARTGLPVLTFDTEFKSLRLPFIGSDNYEGGRLAGEYLAPQIPANGRVIALRTAREATSTQARVDGFLSALAVRSDLDVVSDRYVGSLIEHAFTNSHALLDEFDATGGKVAAIFAPNEISVIAMLRALENVHLDGKVRFIGFDRSPWITTQFLDHDTILALVIQDPNTMGYLSVKALVAAARGQPIPPQTLTEVRLVKHDNASDPRLRQLLHPMEMLFR